MISAGSYGIGIVFMGKAVGGEVFSSKYKYQWVNNCFILPIGPIEIAADRCYTNLSFLSTTK